MKKLRLKSLKVKQCWQIDRALALPAKHLLHNCESTEPQSQVFCKDAFLLNWLNWESYATYAGPSKDWLTLTIVLMYANSCGALLGNLDVVMADNTEKHQPQPGFP